MRDKKKRKEANDLSRTEAVEAYRAAHKKALKTYR